MPQLMEPPKLTTHSLPYQRGMEARANYNAEVAAWFARGAAARELVEKPFPPANPLVNRSGLRWAEGFTHSPEGSFSDEKHANERVRLVRDLANALDQGTATENRTGEDSKRPVAPPQPPRREAPLAKADVLASVPTHTLYGVASCRAVLIVDYSSLLHRAFHAGEPSKIHGVRSMLETVANAIERTCPDFIVFALDGGHAERSQLSPSYKAHRPPRSPLLTEQLNLGEQAIRAIGWPLIRVVGWEADDVAASLVKQIGKNAEQILLATSDKDALQTIPWGASVYKPWDKGQIINARQVRESYGVEPAQMGDYLALVGDKTDGVSGVEGIGEKTAAALLQEHKSLEAAEAGTLTGKGSKQLATPDQRATARTSRQLVELCSELPVGTHWTEFPATEPTAGWRQRLIDLRLGMIAQRLADLLPKQVERERDSYFETTWSRPAPQPTPSQPAMPADIVIVDDAADGPKNYVFRRVSKSPLDRTPPEPTITGATVTTKADLISLMIQEPYATMINSRVRMKVEQHNRHHADGATTQEPERFEYGTVVSVRQENWFVKWDSTGAITSPLKCHLEVIPTVETVPGLFGPTTPLPSEPTAPPELPTIEPPSPLAPLPNARSLPFDEPAASPLPPVGSNISMPNDEDPQLKAGSHVEEINDLDHAAIEAEFTTLQTNDEESQSMATATSKKPAKKTAKAKKVISPVEAVFKLLTQSPELTDRWSKLIASNPTSEQITDQLKSDWVLGARDPSVPCAASTLGTIGVWVGSLTTAGQPALQGHALIAAIREAFGKPYDYKAELVELLGAKFPTKAASDDELTVSINETLRKKTAKQKHATTVNHKTHGTAIWIDQQSTDGEPTFSTTGTGRSLLVAVRQAYEIPLVETPIEISRQIVRKPLDWFKKSEYDRREKRPELWVAELAASLISDGQLQPCLAREDGEHIAGWTRVEAAKYAVEQRLEGWEKLKELDVRIVKCTNTQARRLVLIENAKRQNLTEREKTEAYNDLAAEYRSQGRPQRQLANDLGISEVTLSNNLRMRAIPPEVWERHDAGGFSTDQLRRIATYADRPAFVQKLMRYVSQIEGQPEPQHFEAAFRTGINAAFRPMEQREYVGGGRLFDRKAATSEALQIVEVEINGRKVEMAGNVELWNKLQKAAKQKKQESVSAGTDENLTDAKKRKKEINDGIRENAIHVTWNAARMDAIVAALSGKLSKATRETLVRVVHFLGEGYVPFNERLSLKDISGDDETYTAACLRVLKRALNPQSAHVSPEDLASLAKLTGAAPADHWKPTLHLLSTSSAEELQKFAAELGVTEEGDALIPALLENWTVGWVPAAFKLKKNAK